MSSIGVILYARHRRGNLSAVSGDIYELSFMGQSLLPAGNGIGAVSFGRAPLFAKRVELGHERRHAVRVAVEHRHCLRQAGLLLTNRGQMPVDSIQVVT